MGLHVQVLPADRAEPGAVLTAEDLLGKLESDRIPRPRAQLQVVVDHVVRVELVGRRRVEVVELARANVRVRPRRSRGSACRRRSGGRRARRSKTVAPEACDICSSTGIVRGDRFVALPAEHERLELDVDRLRPDLAGTQAKRPQINRVVTA